MQCGRLSRRACMIRAPAQTRMLVCTGMAATYPHTAASACTRGGQGGGAAVVTKENMALDGCRPPAAHLESDAHSLVQRHASIACRLALAGQAGRLLHTVLQGGCKAAQCWACGSHGGSGAAARLWHGGQDGRLGRLDWAYRAPDRPHGQAEKWATIQGRLTHLDLPAAPRTAGARGAPG